MTQPAAAAADPPAAPAALAVLCPACGYDLRAATSDRCSECGLAIDHSDLARTNFHWPYRDQRGSLRAFLATCWLVTRDGKALRHEAAKSQSVPDALRFRRIVFALAAAAFAIVTGLVLATDGVASLGVDKPSGLAMLTNPLASHARLTDLTVPWSAGITIVPALFVYAIVCAWVVVDAPTRVLRPGPATDPSADAARAIGCYAAAPLALLVPFAAGIAVLAYVDEHEATLAPSLRSLGMLVGSAGAVLLWLAALATIFHTGQWRARTTRRGYATGFLGMAELILRWAIGSAVCYGLLPWCVGLAGS